MKIHKAYIDQTSHPEIERPEPRCGARKGPIALEWPAVTCKCCLRMGDAPEPYRIKNK